MPPLVRTQDTIERARDAALAQVLRREGPVGRSVEANELIAELTAAREAVAAVRREAVAQLRPAWSLERIAEQRQGAWRSLGPC